MKIIGQAKIAPSESVNGYLISNAEGTAPEVVYFEVLRNKMYAEPLKAAGYQLYSVAGNIYKDADGKFTDALPEETVNLETDAMQLNLDLQTGPNYMSIDEWSKFWEMDKQKADTVKFKVEPKYEFFTREDLLTYLSTSVGRSDCRPVNYYAAPEARLTLEQYKADSDYASAIEASTIFDYVRYRKLIKWLQNIGMLGNTYTYFDVLSAYLHWGPIGLRVDIFSHDIKDGVLRNYKPVTSMWNDQPTGSSFLGALDKNFERHVPKYAEKWDVKFMNKDDENKPDVDVVRKLQSKRKDNAAIVVSLFGKHTIRRGEINTGSVRFFYDECQGVYYQNASLIQRMPCLTVRYGGVHTVQSYKLGSDLIDSVKEDMMCYAIAHHVIMSSFVKIKTSSYDLFLDEGCSPWGALKALVDNYKGMLVDEDTGEVVKIEPKYITRYLTDDDSFCEPFNEQEKHDYEICKVLFDEYVAGETNIGDVLAARSVMPSWESLGSFLLCVHEVLGVPASEIYSKVMEIEEGNPEIWQQKDNVLSFTGENGLDMSFKVRPFTQPREIIRAGRAKMKRDHAEFSHFYVWVNVALVELTTTPTPQDRHVGIRGYYYQAANDTVMQARKFLVNKIEEVINLTYPLEADRTRYLEQKYAYANSYLFLVVDWYLRGKPLMLPPELGGCALDFPEDLIIGLKQVRKRIDITTAALCQSTYGGIKNREEGSFIWNTYVCNAKVTIDRVFVKDEAYAGSIAESNMRSHWFPRVPVKEDPKAYDPFYDKYDLKVMFNGIDQDILLARMHENMVYDNFKGKEDVESQPFVGSIADSYPINRALSLYFYGSDANEWVEKYMHAPGYRLFRPEHPAAIVFKAVYTNDRPTYEYTEGADFSADRGLNSLKRRLDERVKGVYQRILDINAYANEKKDVEAVVREDTGHCRLTPFYMYTPEELYLTDYKCLMREYPVSTATVVMAGHLFNSKGDMIDLAAIEGDKPELGIYRITGNSYIVNTITGRKWRFTK